jgi:hypothetical protein
MTTLFDAKIESGALFSPCRTWRYTLWRTWNDGPDARLCAFIGLNPSTADETENDPTIRRCISFAKSWGYDGLVMLNIFAFRATLPEDMKAAIDPVGPHNNHILEQYSDKSSLVIAAWGKHGDYLDRAKAVASMIPNLHCLTVNNDGSPRHPLYVSGKTMPTPWPIKPERTA